MESEIQILVEMGFEKERAQRALTYTGNRGVELAMEWLLSNAEEVVGTEDVKAVESEESAADGSVSAEDASAGTSTNAEAARSLKCEDCKKLFPGIAEAEYHASKSGHSNFSECTDAVKPLTEEEKHAQLIRVQDMLKQRRREREEKEKHEQLDREKARRVMGKEMTQAKQKFEEQEIKKMVDQKKREKEEEKMARQRVRDQIERDKKDREIKFQSSSTANSTPTQRQETSASVVTVQAVNKDYTETRLQIRLPNGEKFAQSFGVKETLAAVRLFVQQTSDRFASISFTFSTTFPRKDFTEDDMQTPLDVLGLVPSSVLMVKIL